MFKLAQAPTYWWPVELIEVMPDGELELRTIRVQFLRLSVHEEDALMAETADKKLSDLEVARRVVTGFRDVADEHGVDLPYTEDHRDKLLAVPGVATAVMAQFFASRNQAALGNLRRSRNGGPVKASTSATAQPTKNP